MQSHIEHSFIYCALFFPYFFCYNALLKVHRRKVARMQKNMIPSKTKSGLSNSLLSDTKHLFIVVIIVILHIYMHSDF